MWCLDPGKLELKLYESILLLLCIPLLSLPLCDCAQQLSECGLDMGDYAHVETKTSEAMFCISSVDPGSS